MLTENLEIVISHALRKGRIVVDGRDYADSISGMKLTVDASDHLPVLELRLPIADQTTITADVCRVLLDEDSRTILAALGWTPPAPAVEPADDPARDEMLAGARLDEESTGGC